jgi:hypothetical protein
MMNRIRTSNFAGYGVALLLFVTIVPSATAKHKPETPTDSVTVVAHVPLPGAFVSQMFLQEHGGNQYLYLQQPSEEGFTIVDVTKPYLPSVVNRVNLANKAPGETLQMIGAGLSITEAPGAGTERSRAELASAKEEGTLDGDWWRPCPIRKTARLKYSGESANASDIRRSQQHFVGRWAELDLHRKQRRIVDPETRCTAVPSVMRLGNYGRGKLLLTFPMNEVCVQLQLWELRCRINQG